MILNNEYVSVSDLFEETVKRAIHLASLATVLQDAMASDGDLKAQYNRHNFSRIGMLGDISCPEAA